MRILRGNQSGSMLVQAIITTVIVGIVSGVIFQQAFELNRNLRAPRIKAAQANVEMALRNLLLQPVAYSNCNSNVGTSSCSLDPGLAENATPTWKAFANIYETVPFCLATIPTTHCGVHIIPTGPPLGFDGASRTFTGKIVYDGNEINIKERDVTIVVPTEVLQSSSIICTNPNPLFAGFNADGTKNCKALPGGVGCPPGQFVTGLNEATLTPICQSLDTASHDCAPGAGYISSLAWTAGGTLTTTCTVRPAPSALWPGTAF